MKEFNIILIISALFLTTSTAQANFLADIVSGESVQDPFSKDDKACLHFTCSAADKKARNKKARKKARKKAKKAKKARLAEEAKMRKWMLEHPRAYNNRIQQDRGRIGRAKAAAERDRKSRVQAAQNKSHERAKEKEVKRIAQLKINKIREDKRKKRLEREKREKRLLLQAQTIADLNQQLKTIAEKSKALQAKLGSK
jgi:hypothetical protein